jgi:polyisoprenoid-binding protein YceI
VAETPLIHLENFLMIENKLIRTALAAALFTTLASAASAVEFSRVLADKSQVAFGFKQMNVPLEGRFKRFTGELSFDPAKPAVAKATIDIDVASIDTGSDEGNDEVVGKLWFDAKTHPRAKFVSTAVKPLGGNRFEVTGQMSIKGRTRAVVVPATFRQDGANGVFEGTLTIKRADYAVGEGMWADFTAVANEIDIRFRIVAAAGN